MGSPEKALAELKKTDKATTDPFLSLFEPALYSVRFSDFKPHEPAETPDEERPKVPKVDDTSVPEENHLKLPDSPLEAAIQQVENAVGNLRRMVQIDVKAAQEAIAVADSEICIKVAQIRSLAQEAGRKRDSPDRGTRRSAGTGLLLG